MNIEHVTRQMADRLRRKLAAEQVWLFGSQAHGTATADSDVDILAVVPSSSISRYQRAVAARRELADFNLPMDVVVLTQEEWDKEIKAPSSLSSTVVREGIPL